MGQFYVSTGSVAQTAAALSTLLAEFDQQLESANSAVTGVVGASWTGDSADVFGEGWGNLLVDAAATRAALASLIQRLGGAESIYESTDSSRATAARTDAAAIRTATAVPAQQRGTVTEERIRG